MTATPNQPPLKQPGRGSARRLVLLCVIFISGVVIGAGLTICTGAKDWPRPPRTSEQRRDALTERIAEKLQFNGEQTEQLRGVLGERIAQVMELQWSISPAKRVQAELLRDQVEAICTDKQGAAWGELYGRLEAKWFQADAEKPAASQPTSQPADAVDVSN
jgi:hypothetical protein